MSNVVQLSDIADIIRGISFPKDAKSLEPRPGDVACLRTTNVQKQVEWDDLWFVPAEHVKRDEQYVKAGDILISTANSYELVGKVAPVTATPHKATLGAFISLIRPRDSVEPRYLYHQLAWRKTQSRIREFASTTTNISNVSTKKLGSLGLAIPSLDNQRTAVAEIEKQFSRLDEAVAGLQRVKANLKRYKAAVLKAAAEGRLVPSEAELARREGRNYETGAQLLQRVLETRRSQWSARGKCTEPQTADVSCLPGLPDGWAWGTAEQLTDFITKGTTPSASKLLDGDGEVQFLKVYNLTFDGSLNYHHKPAFVSRETHNGELARSKVCAGDVLINIVGPPLGQVSVVPASLGEANINQAIARFRPLNPLAPAFLALALMTENIMRWAIRRAKTTSGQSNLTLELCRALPVPIPPLAEQHRIVAEVDRRLSIAREVEAEVEANLKRAQGLRQSCLSLAFGPPSKGNSP